MVSPPAQRPRTPCIPFPALARAALGRACLLAPHSAPAPVPALALARRRTHCYTLHRGTHGGTHGGIPITGGHGYARASARVAAAAGAPTLKHGRAADVAGHGRAAHLNCRAHQRPSRQIDRPPPPRRPLPGPAPLRPPSCAQARAALEEQKSVSSHWMRSCKQAACPDSMGGRLTQSVQTLTSRPPKPWHRCRPTRRSRARSWPRATLPSARAAAVTCGGRPAPRVGPRGAGVWLSVSAAGIGHARFGRVGMCMPCACHVHAMCMPCACHAVCRLGAQLLKLREELGVERQWSTQLQAKTQEMSGDADAYHQTISVLQAASHIPCTFHAYTMHIPRIHRGEDGYTCKGPCSILPCRSCAYTPRRAGGPPQRARRSGWRL